MVSLGPPVRLSRCRVDPVMVTGQFVRETGALSENDLSEATVRSNPVTDVSEADEKVVLSVNEMSLRSWPASPGFA